MNPIISKNRKRVKTKMIKRNTMGSIFKNGVDNYVEKGIKQGKYLEFYPNGFVKKIGYMRKNAVDGYQVEFF